MGLFSEGHYIPGIEDGGGRLIFGKGLYIPGIEGEVGGGAYFLVGIIYPGLNGAGGWGVLIFRIEIFKFQNSLGFYLDKIL